MLDLPCKYSSKNDMSVVFTVNPFNKICHVLIYSVTPEIKIYTATLKLQCTTDYAMFVTYAFTM